MTTKPFKGSKVFLSRSLVSPETFPALHDALKLNGAEVILCCDSSRNGPNDHHVIESALHEKFEDLKSKGCNLLGPQCVLSCAKENRSLPKQQGFTCCLAMDGVKVLASGFDKAEKVKIEELVTSMGGVLQNRVSMDISFVVVKNVVAAKYKWALTVLKKPIVTVSWLYQCWTEHRVVPHEPYKVPPFSGLTICVTRVKADMRKEMEKLVQQNGGKYSPDLTKHCTHLVSDAPEGDKFKVASKWGHIRIVTPKWLEQSVSRRACLDEESYSVQACSTSSASMMKGVTRGDLTRQNSQVKGDTHSQSVQSSVIDLETTLSQNMSSTFSDSTIFTKDEDSEIPNLQPDEETKFDDFVADDSQSDDDDSYLSDCRILFVGFQATEMRKLIKMVQKGGGSRCMSFREEKLTHIIVGTPSENEKKEIRHHAALGIIYVVKTLWLEDCSRQKKEVPVSQRHVSDSFLPKAVSGSFGIYQGRSSMDASFLATLQVKKDMPFESGLLVENDRERKLSTGEDGGKISGEAANWDQLSSLNDQRKDQEKLPHSDATDGQVKRLSIFKGLLFRFSSTFPQDRRAEIVEWVNQGGGAIVDDQSKQNVQFTVDSHGLKNISDDLSQTTTVSSHWIKFCLENGCMADVGSHIIYSPLRCRVPLPGFQSLRFCVSQYDKNDRLLLRNLLHVLGAKFTEKLTKRVTHLLCKFSSGPKYEAACKWGLASVTSEWISECIRQDTTVPVDSFRPKDATAQDREAGLCTMSQYPTQAARMIFGDAPSQFQSQSQVTQSFIASNSISSKKVPLAEGDNHINLSSASKINFSRTGTLDDIGEVSRAVPNKRGVSECMRQDTVPVDRFGRKDVRAQDREIGSSTSQYSTEDAQMVSGDVPAQLPNQSRGKEKLSSIARNNFSSKRVRLAEDDNHAELLPLKLLKEVSTSKSESLKNSTSEDVAEVTHAVPDVAAAIEDLLAESNKIQDLVVPGRSGSDQSIFSSDCSILGQPHVDPRPVFGISKQWSSRSEKEDDLCNSSKQEVNHGPYDPFSETQTESQVVVYEEDLSGRQRIIERVQTRSSLA